MNKLEDLTGQKFGRLTVIKRAQSQVLKNGNKQTMWLCKCECGKEIIARASRLKEGRIKSCGCFKKQHCATIFTTHGKSNTRLFKVWCNMRARCYNKNNTNYKNWGARGITVCNEWKNDFMKFYDWAMANGYDETAPRGKCTIDRIDVNGNYEPSNCRWTNMKTQSRNRRNRNVFNCNGVSFDKRSKKYMASIQIWLGSFDNLEDAIKARKEAEKIYLKELDK